MKSGGWKLKTRVRLESEPDDEVGVLFDTQSATMCMCNDSAWLLLNALKAGATLDGLAAALAAHFDVSEDVARKDGFEFVRQLSFMGFLNDRR